MKHIVLTSMPDTRLAAKWNAFLADATFATHYVTPNYFEDPYVRGDRFAVLAADGRGRVVAVATGVVDDERIASGLFSRPQIVFRKGADREAAFAALAAGIDELNAGGPRIVELHAWDAVSGEAFERSSSSPENSIVMLDLSLGPDAIFKKFSQTRRNEIRRAERENAVEIKEPETFIEQEALYRISCDWNARKGNKADTFEKMKAAIEQRDNRRVFIAKVDGKTVAGSFYRFCPGGVVEYAANFSLPEYQRLRPNDLIGWHAIKWACENGLSHFSMGGSHLFLRRFGGDVMTTYRYTRDDRPFGMRRLTSSVRVFGVETYRRLPENVRAGVRRVFAR
jgi:Acetyltransferase (GNAT) domain